MHIEWKHAAKVAAILGGITAVAALGIGAVNLLTAPIIAQNKKAKEEKSVKLVFANAEILETVELKEKYLNKYWEVALPATEKTPDGRIYSCTGTNGYGTVSLLIGIYGDYSLGNMVILENTESYGSTLEEKYIEPYQSAQDKEAALNQVKCGATFGAKMIKAMVEASVAHYKEAN